MLKTRFLTGYLMAQAGAEPDGGGAPTGGEAKFTQADLDRIIGERLKKFGDYDSYKSKAGEADTLRAELEKLREDAALAGKDELQKAQHRLDAETNGRKADREAHARALTEANARAEASEAKYRARVLEAQVSAALIEGKVYPQAASTALREFLVAAKLESNDEHAITDVILNGRSHSLKDAVKAFLDANPFLAAASGPGGAGTRQGTNGGRPSKPFHELSDDEQRARAFAVVVP